MKQRAKIIFECEDYVVVNKPAQLLSVPDRYNPNIPNLFHQLQKKYNKVYPVHRLDRQTSGIILFALREDFFRHISTLFESRKVDKQYLAIVLGTPMKDTEVIDRPILALSGKNKMVISAKGKKSISIYTVMERFRMHALLNVQIESGRTHQIRVHLSSIGHPLLVDQLYGGQDAFYLSEIKPKYRGDRSEERPLLSRTPLHAHQIRFRRLDGMEATYEAAPPKDMKATLQQFRKLNTQTLY